MVPSDAFEHSGFRAWVKSDDFPSGVRASFVCGEVFLEMSPESIESHNKARQEVTITIGQIARDEGLGKVYMDGALVTNEAAGLSTEPDLTFASWACLDAGRLRFVRKAGRDDDFVEIEGTPDLVVEIVSDSSAKKDLVHLRDAYRRAGIAEYWIVDARGTDLRFEILLLDQGDYRLSAPAGSPQKSSVFARTFTLSRARNRAGRFAYRLTHR